MEEEGQVSSARETILSRIRAGTGPKPGDRADAYKIISRRYTQGGRLDTATRLQLFQQRLQDYDAAVYQCAEAEIPQTIAQAMSARTKTGLLIAGDVPASWLPDGFTFRADEGMSYEALDQVPGVLTGCATAIALTGTIILRHTRAAGRRAITLIPDYHLCLVFSSQIVETVPEAIRRMERVALGQEGQPPLTTVSGPSATSDIEMTRVKGVHGPRVLDVILVQEPGG